MRRRANSRRRPLRAPCSARLTILTTVLFAVGVGAQPRSLVVNGGFERGGSGWSLPPGSSRVVDSARGGKCLEMTGGGAVQDVYVGRQEKTFTAAVDMKAAGIVPDGAGGYAYVAVYQLDSRGEYVAFRDFAQTRTGQDWTRHTFTFEAHPEARIISLRCGVFQAKGTAWFDNWTLTEGKDALPFTEGAEPRGHTGSATGVVGIFRQSGFPAKGAASSPATIAEILQEAGLETRFVDLAELSDPTRLRPSSYDLIVLPYGESFPATARDSTVYYLHAGGDFLSTGGYAFNNLLLPDGDRYLPEQTVLDRRLADAMNKSSLLADGGFEKEETRAAPVGGEDLEARWHRTADSCQVVSDAPAQGQRCARVAAADMQAGHEVKWDLRVPANRNRRYRVSAQIKTQDVGGLGFAYLAMYRYGEDGELRKHTDFAQVRGTTDWKRYDFDFTPEPGAAVLYVKCGLYQASGTAWFDDVRLADISGTEPRPMNTATGSPQDGLDVSPTQIGVFDADYRLRRVSRVETAPDQTIFPAGIKLGSAQGWAASGVRGYDQTRWIPLLMAYDRYGRPRGSAGSLLINYGGFYSGSAWGYFGAEDRDLFDGKDPKVRTALQRLVRFIVRGVYLRNLTTDLAAYRPGETVKLQVVVENRGAADQQTKVTFKALSFERSVETTVKAGETATPSVSLPLPKGVAGLCRVTAALSLAGEPVDRMESGFVALSDNSAIRHPTSAMPLRFSANYLRYGDRPLFLFGCDNYSNVYQSTTEGPLWWAREHAACRDFGFELYENLQYGNPGHAMKDEDWRRFAGMAQLTQEHGLTFMPGLLIGQNVAVSHQEIAEESRQCSEYAAHLKDTPKLLWYINGDYQLRHDDKEALTAKWNAFLRERYGTTEKLKAAWAPDDVPAEVGSLPFPPANSGRWDDVRQMDLLRFHVKLMTDWNKAHVAAIRAEDREHPITSEYYQMPFWGMDLRLSIDGQDVSNIGYFDEPVRDIDLLPIKLRWNDLRAQGKSVGLGEYGVKTHPAWAVENGGRGYHLVRTEEQAKQLFMAVAHYTFGMGGSKVQNWCLRDADQRVFPWGVFYPGPLIPKDLAYTHRNLSLLFRLFEPVYEAPPLTVLICDNMRLGNAERLGIDSAYRCFAALLGLHVDFNVASDWFADQIPVTTKAALYPAALCPSDESFEAVMKWVRAGGVLLTTGGPVYDADRKLTRTDRLKELAGVEWLGANYAPPDRPSQTAAPIRAATMTERARTFDLPDLQAAPLASVKPAGAVVLATDANGAPVLTRQQVGNGVVYYVADPVELAPGDGASALRPLYEWFLRRASIAPSLVTPDDPQLHVFAQKTRTGRAHVVFSSRTGDSHQDVKLPTKAGEVVLGVKDRYPALAAVGDDGTVSVLGAYQSAKIGDTTVLSAGGLVTATTLDGADLRKSAAVMLLPFSTGKVTLTRSRPWKRPVALLGDLYDGRFRPLETLDLKAGAAVTIDFDADRATLLALVCERGTEPKWQGAISKWVSAPGEMRGR